MSTKEEEKVLNEGVRLMELSDETLLEVLGLQLLAVDHPGRAVGVAMYLSSSSEIVDVAQRIELGPTEALIPVSVAGIGEIIKQSRERERKSIF